MRKRSNVDRSGAIVLAALLSALSAPAFAQTAEDLRRLEALDAVCLKARASKIRSAQQQKIEECVHEVPQAREAKKSRGECETYWSDYGWTTGALAGSRKPHLFADLPECKTAFEARQKYRTR